MRLAQCNLVQLAEESGVSQATICRYRSGKRTPKANSEHVVQISGALSRLAERNGVASVDASAILRQLNRTLEEGAMEQQELNTEHFGALVAWMEMNYSELAPKISYDASTISRIRSGKRRPADPRAFAESVAQVALDTLTEDKIITVDGKYHLTVTLTKDGAAVTESDCPGQDCLHTGRITRAGQSIVCLPEQVIVTLEGKTPSADVILG